MKTYLVGGAVRDALLGIAGSDRDYVVVGATPEDMVRAGFRPVGKDFPVFLHPQTNEEYALARTERKTARGYKGFQIHAAPDVTLEQDLARRDLTINAMARDEAGDLVDPYGGADDLKARVLRHVSPAFAEDPVRILRVARFAARFAFDVAPETMALMRAMVDAGEADALVPERVWQEFARGLAEAQPGRMFAVLAESGALERVLPEWRALDAQRALAALACAAARHFPLAVRYAALFAGAAPGVVESAAARLRAPNDCRDLARLVVAKGPTLGRSRTLDADSLVSLFEAADAFRRPERFVSLLEAADCVAIADSVPDHYVAAERVVHALKAAMGVDAGAVAREHPQDIPAAVRAARVAAVESALRSLAVPPAS
ncbi:MAG: multifunctional CCA tRNA nucleotidyl transferase/2'3'-cyclic phosphodiesterase/2'nucleotidase/phosphatase [Burkholderiales bacterium]|jgi:tRNA nucleotidyltransferase (CCA-adding enzyme)|nr:multifunctional CCA tRNA nucleotidyl transferase/2'3'-cyclic phosphodiesterase/2'nucleotidase/phosphatase [Burkholderiales bacterium]